MKSAKPASIFKPSVLLFYCSQSLSCDKEIPDRICRSDMHEIRFEVIPCSSKIDIADLLNILEKGWADGIEIVGCTETQCRFLVGSTVAENRIEYIRGLLDQIQMGADRIGITHKNKATPEDLYCIAKNRAEAVFPLGPNPMKKPEL